MQNKTNLDPSATSQINDTMRDAEPEVFPDTRLPLQEFARRGFRSLWEDRARTKKNVVDANARGSIASRLAGYDGAKPRSSVVLIEAADAAATALWDAVRDGMKRPGVIVCGIPKGEHNYVEIADALLDRARLINWSKGIIACAGGRRFEFVRVFHAIAEAKEPAIPSVGSELPAAPVVHSIANSERLPRRCSAWMT